MQFLINQLIQEFGGSTTAYETNEGILVTRNIESTVMDGAQQLSLLGHSAPVAPDGYCCLRFNSNGDHEGCTYYEGHSRPHVHGDNFSSPDFRIKTVAGEHKGLSPSYASL